MSETVLITGCSSGIGQALAREFHQYGHTVYATARRVETLQVLADEGIRTAALDVNSSDSIEALVARLNADNASVSILVNNAGYGAMGPMLEMPMTEVRQQFETNVFSIVSLVQAIAPQMIAKRRGKIINVGSVSGILTTPFAGTYCATKAAVHAMSDAMRMELAPFGIEVIVVQPGAIESQFGATASKGVSSRKVSIYEPVADAIAARANASQVNATSAKQLAQTLVKQVLSATPPAYTKIGHGSFALPLMQRYLPTKIIDKILSKKFNLNALAK